MKINIDNLPKVIFVTGTGTDVGKSYAAGCLARTLTEEGKRVITQKLIQTGNHGMSEDIEVHRRIMGIPLQPRDLDHTTAPIILSYPASPHLAARIDNVEVDWSLADKSTEILASEFDTVLIEGAGGLMVPLTEEMLCIDFIRDHKYPVAVIVNGQLGAINHAVLTLRALEHEGIPVWAVIYNPFFDSDKIIADENREYLRRYTAKHHPYAQYLVMA